MLLIILGISLVGYMLFPSQSQKQDIKKIYNNLYLIKSSQNPTMSKWKLQTVCSVNTMKTIIEYKYHYLISYLFRPVRVSEHLFGLDYYSSGEWYTALIPSSAKHVKSVLRIEHLDSEGKLQDVTEKIKPYLGPKEDFHKQQIYPALLGYKHTLVFTVMKRGFPVSLSFSSFDPIVLN